MPDTYCHLIGGEVSGRRHEPGDVVDPSTPPRKIKEWAEAKIIKRERQSQTKPTEKEKPRDERRVGNRN